MGGDSVPTSAMAQDPHVLGEASAPSAIEGGNPSAAAVKATLAKVSESFREAIAQQRPWSEVVDRTSFSRPEGLNDALGRLRKNVVYFKANYIVVILGMVALSLLFSPISIFWIAFLGCAWIYLFMIRSEPLVIGGRILNETEKFIGMLVISLLMVFGLTSVGSVLISGVVVGCIAIAFHAATRVPDDLFIDQVQSNGGYLSFLGGVNTQGAAV
eukprot:TRINITY_DN662_c0_g2_i1.p1 TRINITY_DN662_c0_g2~~TRINITY_DN662_c0_g2_i1.p1  ORF type:complete len:214 (-),score=13.83 TRINITY_DN662_c0_g2_i1:246-887(-)